MTASDVSVHFDGVKAVDGVNLTLRRGEILGVIGPNGAGKTTLVNALSGFVSPTRGSVLLGTRDVTGWAAARLGRLGLTRTFQDIRLFKDLTTYENVAAGAVGVRIPRKDVPAWIDEILDRLDLSAKRMTLAGNLAHGDQRRAALARALATRPAFLLLDEPTAGLTELETDALVETMRRISSELGCGTLVIEHDMRLIMGACDRIQVLDHGTTIAVGKPAEIRVNPAVLAAYFRTSGGPDAGA